MATDYILPQVRVFQQFRQISQDVVGNLNACIIGPHYQLARYNESSEKELTKLNALYVGDMLDSEYPLNARNVDVDYVKVFFEKAVGRTESLDNAYILDGVVYNNYVKGIDFLKSVGKEIYGDSIVLHDFKVDQLASGDKIYFVPCIGNYRAAINAADNGEFLYDHSSDDYIGHHCAVLLKSERTGKVSVLSDADISKLGLADAVDDYMHASVSRQQLVWGLDSYDGDGIGALGRFGYRLCLVGQASAFDGKFGCLILRPEVVVEYIDKLQANPALAGKIRFSVINSDVSDVVVEKSDYGIRVKIPYLGRQTSDDIRDALVTNVALQELFRVAVSNVYDHGVIVRPYITGRQSFTLGTVTKTGAMSVVGRGCSVDGSPALKGCGLYTSSDMFSSSKKFSALPNSASVLFADDRYLVCVSSGTSELYSIVDGKLGSRVVQLPPDLALATINYSGGLRVLYAVSTSGQFYRIEYPFTSTSSASFPSGVGFEQGDYDYDFGSDFGRITSFSRNGKKFVLVLANVSGAPKLVLFDVGGSSLSTGALLTIDVPDNADSELYGIIDHDYLYLSSIAAIDSSVESVYAVVHNREEIAPVIIARFKFTDFVNDVPTHVTFYDAPGQCLRLPADFKDMSIFSGRLLVLNGDFYTVQYSSDHDPVSITPLTDRSGAFPFGFGRGAAVATVGTIGDLGVGIGSVIAHGHGYSSPVSGFAYANSEPYSDSVAKVVTDPGIVRNSRIFNYADSAVDCVNAGGCGVQISGTYAGNVDTVYILTVTAEDPENLSIEEAGRLVLGIYDTAGIDTPQSITLTTDNVRDYHPLGSRSGLQFQFYGNENLWTSLIRKGESFAVHCFAPKETVNGVRLLSYIGIDSQIDIDSPTGGDTPNPILSASICKSYGSLEIPEFNEAGMPNWIATDEGIILSGGIQTRDPDGKLVTVDSAQPYVEYRALLTTYSDTIHEVEGPHDVQTMLGSISMDNPLAQGCYHAVLNSGQQAVFFIAVKSDDQKGYDAALERLEVINNIYSLVPMTTDDAVLDDVQAHVDRMSGSETKLWRIGVVGISTDKTIAIYNNAHHKLDKEFDATIIGDLVTFAEEDETVATDEVWPGDEFRYNYSDGDEYEVRIVDSVIDNRHIRLTEPVDEDVVAYAKCEVWRNLTSAQWIDHVADKISAFRDRRMYAIFPEVLWNNGNKYPGYIGAAAIAGLISSVPPQQGLTNIALNGFDDIPAVYSSYTREQLNKIAGHGGLIIMQDVPNGQVYVRHQVSTARLDGNVLTTELSVTKDLDAISYYMAGILEPYVGKYNITPILLEQIRTTVQGALNYLGSYNTGSGLLGPMLLADSEDTKIIGIRQHETLKNHIIVSVSLDLPLPCNVIDLYLSV